jgi:SagB-type dehydrogenase family enzyme
VAQGITHDESLRAVPSAGALYPLELYLVVGHVAGLSAGIYKYHVAPHGLELCLSGDQRGEVCRAAYSQECVRQASAIIAICAMSERETQKYGMNGSNFIYLEAGCAAENVALQAVSLGLGMVIVGAIDSQAMATVLGTRPNEQPLCLLPLGKI